MANNILDTLGIDQESYDSNTGSTLAKGFVAMESGVYPGRVKEVILYTNVYGGEELKINVEVDGKAKDNSDVTKVISFRKDIGKTLKDGKINEGFVARFKSLAVSANVELGAISPGESVKVNSYGKECDGNYLLGCNDKPVLVATRYTVDTNKAEGEMYRDSNDIEALLVKDSEDMETFLEKVKKQAGNPFTVKGYVAKDKKTPPATADQKAKISDLDF